jgi:uncharacterized protein
VQRKAIIFHGTGGSPEGCWYRWLDRRLAERGYPVDGHFGDHDQPYPTFELLDKRIDQ